MVSGANIHLLTLSTGLPHPQAQQQVLHLTLAASSPDGTSISVSGNLLGVMSAAELCIDSTELHVVNWRTGETRLVRSLTTS